MAAEEGMETPPQDLLLDLPVDVGAVEGGDRYRRRLERATTATATGRGDRCHHFVGGHCYILAMIIADARGPCNAEATR